jgi:hypothetical protein
MGAIFYIALMVFATGAHAEGNWQTGLKNLSAPKSFTGATDTTLDILVELSSKSHVAIECKAFTVAEGSLLVGGKSVGEYLLSQCETHLTLGGVEQPMMCHPSEPIAGKVQGELVLKSGTTYEVLEPAEEEVEEEKIKGTKVLSIHFGESCLLGEELSINGSFVIQDCHNAFETELVQHLVEQAPSELFPEHALTTSTHPTVIDGSVLLELSKESKGEQWRGVG